MIAVRHGQIGESDKMATCPLSTTLVSVCRGRHTPLTRAPRAGLRRDSQCYHILPGGRCLSRLSAATAPSLGPPPPRWCSAAFCVPPRGGRPVVRGWTELRTEPRTEPRTGQSPNPPELRPRTTAPYDGVSPPYDGPNHGRTVGRRIVVSATDQGPPIHGSARHISPPYVLCEARMRDCPALHHTSLKRSLYQTLAFGHRMRLSR